MYRGGIIIKTPEQIEQMAAAGAIQARCLKMLRSKVRAGRDHRRARPRRRALHRLAGRRRPRSSATAASRARSAPRRTRWSSTGSPAPYELRRGDIISLDVGVTYDGWVADAAITVGVGEILPAPRQLLETTKAALFAAVEQVAPGNHLGDVSHAVQKRVEAEGLSIIRSLVGHGIGRDMHEDPQVPNYGEPGRGPELEPGMVLAIEPMVNAGGPDVRLGDDNWAVYSADGSLAAHFEFTVAVTEDGPRILTPWHLRLRTGTSRRPRGLLSVDAPAGPASLRAGCGGRRGGARRRACEADTDGDGVPDASDRCPTVAAQAAGGCPRVARRVTIVAQGHRVSGEIRRSTPLHRARAQ